MQHLIYKKEKTRKSSHRKKKTSIIEETKNTEPNEPPVGSILEHYLDRQNELMARLLKDLREDKKLENLRQQELLEKLNSSSGRYRSLPPNYSAEGYSGRSFFSPLKMHQSHLSHHHHHHDRRDRDPYGEYYEPMECEYCRSRRLPPPRQDYVLPEQRSRYEPLPIQPRMTLPKKRVPNTRRAKSLLKTFMWVLATPGLWFISVAKWAEKRRKEEVDQLRYVVPRNMEVFFIQNNSFVLNYNRNSLSLQALL